MTHALEPGIVTTRKLSDHVHRPVEKRVDVYKWRLSRQDFRDYLNDVFKLLMQVFDTCTRSKLICRHVELSTANRVYSWRLSSFYLMTHTFLT